MTDIWTRTYELWDSGLGMVRHIYRWTAEPPSTTLAWGNGPARNVHPLWSYTPAAVNAGLTLDYPLHTKPAFTLEDVGWVTWRIVSVPTANTDDPDYPYWDGSTFAIEEVMFIVNLNGLERGNMVDVNGVPVVWEWGDFEEAVPSWAFAEAPTHFRVLNVLLNNVAMIQPLIATAEGLRAASIAMPNQVHVLTLPRGSGYSPADTGAVRRMSGNGGPTNRRLMPMRFVPKYENGFDYPAYPSMVWDTATGDVLMGESDSFWERRIHAGGITTAYEYDPSAYWEVRYRVVIHRSTLPVVRFRQWVGVYAPGSLGGAFSVAPIGIYGRGTAISVPFGGTVDATGADYSLAHYDASLDLGSLTLPNGTYSLEVTVTAYSDFTPIGRLAPECALAADFVECGTRSEWASSVYLPGRVLKVGNIPLDGSTPT